MLIVQLNKPFKQLVMTKNESHILSPMSFPCQTFGRADLNERMCVNSYVMQTFPSVLLNQNFNMFLLLNITEALYKA